MRFSENWLREWADPELDRQALVQQLTMLGLEVDAAEPAAAEFSGVVVGHVLAVVAHPESDKLSICEVAAGEEQTCQVVCGAPNVRAGVPVPYARPGASLPGGRRIETAVLKGVESQGMLCSEKELGLSDDGAGLMILAADAPAGVDLHDYLGLDDLLIEIDLTPNRGDCLSIRGVAREISARNRTPLHPPAMPAVAPRSERRFAVKISDRSGQTRYVGRVIEGIDTSAHSPQWLVERLRRSGVRAISPVVDVTNYVMLELGQPMHAFDLARLAGGIEVRNADDGESITLLDETELRLSADTLVIADADGPVALAGIMGGLHSGVEADTRDIFLESAFFAPEWIAGRPRRYGLATDSAHRFERGVDPQLQELAMERATALLVDIVGGTPGPLTSLSDDSQRRPQEPIVLRPERIRRLLGVPVGGGEVSDVLTRLGMQVEERDGHWLVTPPSYRFDVRIEADLIEELARIRGYDHLPRTHPPLRPRIAARQELRRSEAQLRRILVERGYQEAITYSFVDPVFQRELDPAQEPLALANPLSADLSVMRTSLWPGLAKTLGYNLNRQQPRVRLFEVGLNFRGEGDGLAQVSHLAGMLSGPVEEEQWGTAPREADFYDAKGDLEALFPPGTEERFRFEPGAHPALHPGQCARVTLDGEPVGWLGAVHPSVAAKLEISAAVYCFEVATSALLAGRLPSFAQLSRFPAVRRDIALVVDEGLPADALLAAVRSAAPEFLRQSVIFDVYRGSGVTPGRKSVALGLILQDLSRTLTDDEVDNSVARILARLRADLGAELRN